MTNQGSSAYRARARAKLAGHWGSAIGTFIVPFLLVLVVFYAVILFGELIIHVNTTQGLITATALLMIVLIVVSAVAYGLIGICFNLVLLRWYDTNKPSNWKQVFAILQRHWWPLFKISILQYIFICLWMLLLYIPGIIKSFSYSQAMFVYFDRVNAGETNVSALDCITASRKMMDGHKWQFFVLQLTFIGWVLLSTVTMGLGYLWLVPYICMASCAFYRYLSSGQKTSSAQDAVYTAGMNDGFDDRFEPNASDFDSSSDSESATPKRNSGQKTPVNEVSQTINPAPTVENDLYNQAMGGGNGNGQDPNQRPPKKGHGGLIAVVVVVALLIMGTIFVVVGKSNSESGSSSHETSSAKTSKKNEKKSHDGITPSSDFDDGMDTTDAEDIRDNKFDPSSNQLMINYEQTANLTKIKEFNPNWQRKKWMDSTVTIDKGWIATFKPVKADIGGSKKDEVSGVVILHLTIKTGKYDNTYYPSQGDLVTNLGSSYEPSLNSTIIDGGVPHNSTRSVYLYIYPKQQINNVDQISTLNFKFTAYASDKQTENANDSEQDYEMNLTNLNN